MFMRDISALVRHMRTYAEREMSTFGLGFPEQVILMYLSTQSEIPQGQIARAFDIDRAAIAKTAAKLEEKGYITRVTNAKSKREKLLSLTPAAAEALDAMSESFDRWQRAAFEGVSAEDRALTDKVIERVASNTALLLKDGESL